MFGRMLPWQWREIGHNIHFIMPNRGVGRGGSGEEILNISYTYLSPPGQHQWCSCFSLMPRTHMRQQFLLKHIWNYKQWSWMLVFFFFFFYFFLFFKHVFIQVLYLQSQSTQYIRKSAPSLLFFSKRQNLYYFLSFLNYLFISKSAII